MSGRARDISSDWPTPYTGNMVENSAAARWQGFQSPTPFSVVDGWKRSPKHRVQLLKPQWLACGASQNSYILGNFVETISLLQMGDTTDLTPFNSTITPNPQPTPNPTNPLPTPNPTNSPVPAPAPTFPVFGDVCDELEFEC